MGKNAIIKIEKGVEMEVEKNNNSGLITLVIILCLLVLGLGGYIVYDKVLADKPAESIIDDKTNSNENNNDNNEGTIENNNVTNTIENNNVTNTEESKNNECPSFNCESSINFDKLAKISKSTYNFVKSAYNSNYSILLLQDGKVLINFSNNLSNVSNAKDLILFSGPGAGDIAYILTTDGYVYKYDLSNSTKNNFEAVKLDEYSNIKQMTRYMTRKANAGGCDYVVVIDANDEYHSIDSYCV